MNLMKIIKLQNLILSLVVYEKLNHLIFIHKIVTWHRVHASLLWYFSHTFSFFFINCFIASIFLFIPLPHSLPMYLSQTSTISISISCSISLLPSLSLLFCSPYLTPSFTFSLFDATSDYSSLYVCDIIPLLLSFLLWYCFVFVLMTIIFLLLLLLAIMKINILEKSFPSISHEFLYFSLFLYFIYFCISSIYIFLINYCFYCFSLF